MHRIRLLLVTMAIGVSSVRGADSEPRSEEIPVLLATEPGLIESGLVKALMDQFRQDTSIKVELCNDPKKSDLRLLPAPVPSRDGGQEERAPHGREIFWSTLLVLGPADGAKRSYGEYNYSSWGRGRSPLGTRGSLITKSSASQLLKEIGLSWHPIVICASPGWVRTREQALWATRKPRANRIETGESLARTLEIASEKSAYALTDAATFLGLRQRLELDLILARDSELRVSYRAILREKTPRNPAPPAQVRRLHEWLDSDSCKAVIRRFQIDGSRAFYVSGEELSKNLRGRLDIESDPTEEEDQ